MNSPIYATWCISDNIGDALTPWLIKQITGQTPIYVPPDVEYPKYMLCGSMLNHAIRYTTVWGAGFACEKDQTSRDIHCLAVRGPLVARIVRSEVGPPVEVIGDPSLLLPDLYNKPVEKKYKVGICPHYLHQAEAMAWLAGRTDIAFINVFDEPHTFITSLQECEVIYSSSLHGLIIADAFGIPSVWIEGTEPLGGDGFKFDDYLVLRDYVGQDPTLGKLTEFVKNIDVPCFLQKPIQPIHLQQLSTDIDQLHEAHKWAAPPDYAEVRKRLWSVCPFEWPRPSLAHDLASHQSMLDEP